MGRRVQGFLRKDQDGQNVAANGYKAVWKTGRASVNKKRQLLNGPDRPST